MTNSRLSDLVRRMRYLYNVAISYGACGITIERNSTSEHTAKRGTTIIYIFSVNGIKRGLRGNNSLDILPLRLFEKKKKLKYMDKQMTVISHSESDANTVINSLNDEQLRKLMLITFVDNIAYSVYLDMYKGCVITTCYPYAIKVNKTLVSCFRDAIFAIYHDNFL